MKIHPLTYLYLFLAFISRSSYYVAFLLFSILHEIGHYLVALYFSFEIEKIMILPFGAFLLLKDLGKHYVYEFYSWFVGKEYSVLSECLFFREST